MQATSSVIHHISILREQEEKEESKDDDNVNEMLVRLNTLIRDVDDVVSTSSSSSSSTSTSSNSMRWEYLFRGRWTPWTHSTINENLNSARQRGLEEIEVRFYAPPHRRHGRRHRRVAVNVLVSLEENRMYCNTDRSLHDVPVRQVEIEEKKKKINKRRNKKLNPIMKTSFDFEIHSTLQMLSETHGRVVATLLWMLCFEKVNDSWDLGLSLISLQKKKQNKNLMDIVRKNRDRLDTLISKLASGWNGTCRKIRDRGGKTAVTVPQIERELLYLCPSYRSN